MIDHVFPLRISGYHVGISREGFELKLDLSLWCSQTLGYEPHLRCAWVPFSTGMMREYHLDFRTEEDAVLFQLRAE